MPALVNVDSAALLARRPRAVGRAVESGAVDGKARGRFQVQNKSQDAGIDDERQERHEDDETGAGQQTTAAHLVHGQVALNG